MRTNARITLGLYENKPTTMILRLEVTNHIMPQKIGHSGVPGRSEPSVTETELVIFIMLWSSGIQALPKELW